MQTCIQDLVKKPTYEDSDIVAEFTDFQACEGDSGLAYLLIIVADFGSNIEITVHKSQVM